MAKAEPYYEVTQLPDGLSWNIDKYICLDLIAVYKVECKKGQYSCNCPAGVHHKECKHLDFVKRFRQKYYAMSAYRGIRMLIVKNGRYYAKQQTLPLHS